MSEEAEMRKWMQRYFPGYVDDQVMTEYLFAKHVKKEKCVSYETKDIAKLGEGDISRIEGLVKEYSIHTYHGCSKEDCRRKDCEVHKDGIREYQIRKLRVEDKTESIWITKWDGIDSRISKGDQIACCGRVRLNQKINRLEMWVNAIDVVKTSSVGVSSLRVMDVKAIHGKVPNQRSKDKDGR